MEGNFQSSFGRLAGVAKNFGKNLASTLGAGISIGGIVAFGRQIFSLADQLQNLSDQTKISVELLSGLKSPLEESGTSLDAFARGIFNLQKNLGNVDTDSDKVAQSIKRLGLNLDELRNTSPDDFIKKVSEALAGIANPVERSTLLFNLLGKQAKELGPAFEQLIGRFDQFKRAGLTAADVKLIDDVGDALTRLKNQALLLGTEGAAGILRFFGIMSDRDKFLDSLMRIEDEIRNLDQMLERRKSLREKGLGFFVPSTEDDEKALQKRRQLLEEQRKIDEQLNQLNAQGRKPSLPFTPLAKPLAAKSEAISMSAADSFIASLKKQADQLEINIKTELGGADAARKLGLELEFAAVKAKMLADGKILPADFEQRFKEAVATIETLSQRLAEAKFQGARLDEVGKMFSQDSAEWLTLEKDIYGVVAALEKLTTEWDKMRVAQVGAMFDQDSAEWWTEQEGRGLEIWRQQDEIRKRAGEMFGDIGGSISRGIGDTLRGIREGSQTLSEGMRNLVQNIFLSINEQVIETTILKPIQDIVNGFFTGLAEAFATGSESSAKDIAQNLGKSLGEALRGLFSSSSSTGGIGSWIGTAFSWIGSLFTFKQGGFVPAFANGGLVKQLQRFDDGGLAIVHPNEFVIKSSSVRSIGAGNLDMMNRSGKMPGGGMSQPTPIVQINGDIIPRGKWTTPEDVVKISYKSMKDRTGVYAAMRDYGPRR